MTWMALKRLENRCRAGGSIPAAEVAPLIAELQTANRREQEIRKNVGFAIQGFGPRNKRVRRMLESIAEGKL